MVMSTRSTNTTHSIQHTVHHKHTRYEHYGYSPAGQAGGAPGGHGDELLGGHGVDGHAVVEVRLVRAHLQRHRKALQHLVAAHAWRQWRCGRDCKISGWEYCFEKMFR